ncbi:MAG TPA: ABC transporter permease [Nanoarchaeota archaeon]|nr:ABC transporter permease [Nanoarchaeota archaeon]
MKAEETDRKEKKEESGKLDGSDGNVQKMLDSKKQGTAKDYSGLVDDGQKKSKTSFLAKLFYIIMKDYKLLIRSRTSALIFLIGPLLIMALVSIGFNTSSLYGVNIAAFSEGYSGLSDSLVSNLSGGEYLIQKIATQDECINSVKLGQYPVCIVFPKDMAMDNSARNVITLFIDESRINIANAITEKLSSKVSLQASQLSAGVVSQMLGALDTINKETEAGKSSAVKLTANNAEEVSKLAATLSKIESFDFTFGAIDSSAAATEVNKVRDKYNLSSSEFSGVTTAINDLVTQYNSATGKLNTAKDNAAEVQENAQDAKDKVSADAPIVRDVNTRLGNVKASIGTVKITNVDAIVSPLKVAVQPLSKTKSYFLYIMPSLLALLVMLVSLLISATGIMREKESSAYLRNFITPTMSGTFLLAHYITFISIILMQSVVMLGVTRIFVSGIPIVTYLLAMAVLLIFATIFIGIGMFIGSIFNTSESVTVAAVSVAILTVVFSNTLLPLETLSGFLRMLVEFNPFVMAESMMKGLFLFGISLSTAKPFYIMLGLIGAAAVLTIVSQTMKEKIFK